MKILRMLKRVLGWAKYILIFCIGMLITSVVYPYIQAYAIAHRASTAPGGELLLWLLPFMACFALSTAKQWKN